MNHLDQAGFNIPGAITAVLPLAQKVYTGDEDGRVVSSFFPFIRPFAGAGGGGGWRERRMMG